MTRKVRTGAPASGWRYGVPVVCLLAGLLLAATHGVSGGNEIRASDSPRLVDLVNEAQGTVDRLAAQRDALSAQIDATHGRSSDVALAAMQARAAELAGDEDDLMVPAAPDDLVVHQQDIQAVVNALWSAGAEAIQMQDQRLIATSAPRCVGNTLLLNGRTYSPPYVVTVIGDVPAMRAALESAPLVTLYKQYVVRFGLGYTEEARTDLQIAGFTEPVRMRYAVPAGPTTTTASSSTWSSTWVSWAWLHRCGATTTRG